uniref:Putative secreted protein n=1 Tax=Anopheles triannulatus TaxID=58253 RepID=A0A2M4B0G2_9DIPT
MMLGFPSVLLARWPSLSLSLSLPFRNWINLPGFTSSPSSRSSRSSRSCRRAVTTGLLGGRGHTEGTAGRVGDHHILDRGHLGLEPGQLRLQMDVLLGLLADDDRGRNGGDLTGGGGRGHHRRRNRTTRTGHRRSIAGHRRTGQRYHHLLFRLRWPLVGRDAGVALIRRTITIVPGGRRRPQTDRFLLDVLQRQQRRCRVLIPEMRLMPQLHRKAVGVLVDLPITPIRFLLTTGRTAGAGGRGARWTGTADTGRRSAIVRRWSTPTQIQHIGRQRERRVRGQFAGRARR